ncbi:DUF4041 domain-containing protein [Shouchella miscanthi]|uniref:DUF4041 domain-containing protein n=1 Tax=Shouchella miscanthi TaxID=2598861 RepID=UPI001AEEA598|nr:DUF4041 domain-containing protein [Shouchella miscanthi]
MYKDRWYYSTWLIMVLALFSIFIVPAIIAIILLILQVKNRRKTRQGLMNLKVHEQFEVEQHLNNKYQELESISSDIEQLKLEKEELVKQLSENQYNLSLTQQELENTEHTKKEIKEQSSKMHALIERFNSKLKEYKEERHNYLKKKMEFNTNKTEFQMLQDQKDALQEQVVILEEEALLQSFGFYEPKYSFDTSTQFKEELSAIRKQQREMVKNKLATNQMTDFTFNGSVKKGQAFMNESAKMAIRAFNVECENAISKVTLSNIQSTEKRIHKSAESIKKTNRLCEIEISQEYINLKIEELYLAFEFEQQKEAEREEQRMIKEQIREEAKAQKEIQAERAKIEKEEQHFNIKIRKLQERLDKEEAQELVDQEALKEREELLKQINSLNDQLQSVQKDKENVFVREKNTRAGYVYIISNIGSFGDNIYKIGVTRRLEPFDRVKELGSASVPFNFDVHAMIFSNDAPRLEKQLHDAFVSYSVNKMNTRKEFFKVSLSQIEKFVNTHHDKTVIFTKIAEAAEYRQSLALEQTVEQSVS